ncbi:MULTISPECIES: HAD-IIIC family phosphatase [Microbacterium]|uniref:FkbH-like protein n=1 Tax=Microbacterium amylolyticum TaxID=936337 RepID=A0ABS4ZHN9_9MICO|nr:MULTISPECIES: HAD-IIIC family phosphatase [Microbacterium]MBP2436790.1 FkbH-like protein [Microbacterium amylolyticum]
MTNSMTLPAVSAVAKCVVWDLDDTLWTGTLSAGDDLVLRDGVREIVMALDERGILQSIASKNNHDDAWAQVVAFSLDEYFLEPQINWGPKSASVKRLSELLSIGIDTLVFVDDRAMERDEVAFAHPSVETVDSADLSVLLAMPRLSPEVVTEDARRRRSMYVANRQRTQDEETHAGPHDDFLRTLDLTFDIAHATADDLDRAEELTFRTNQLNSTGIHYSRADLEQLLESDEHDVWVCELDDRYGSYGKIGLALVHRTSSTWTIKLLLMSCRTLSTGAGTVLLNFLIRRAAAHEVALHADFRRTDRNRQMLLTYRFAGFVQQTDSDLETFEWDGDELPTYPDYIKVTTDEH